MIQTETSKAKLLFISVPNDAARFEIDEDLFYLTPNTDVAQIIELPKGNWTILNTLDEVTDDEAEMVMSSYYCDIDCDISFWYKENGGAAMFDTAKEAIQSLATSLGVEGKTIILYELK